MIKEKPPRKAKSLSDKPELDYKPIDDKKLNWAMCIWVLIIALAGWGLIYSIMKIDTNKLVAETQPTQLGVELPKEGAR